MQNIRNTKEQEGLLMTERRKRVETGTKAMSPAEAKKIQDAYKKRMERKRKNQTIHDRWATDPEPTIYTKAECQEKMSAMTERRKQMAEEDPAVSVRSLAQFKKEQAAHKKKLQRRRKKIADSMKDAE